MLEMQILRRVLKDNYIELPIRKIMQSRYRILLDEFINQYELPYNSSKDPLKD